MNNLNIDWIYPLKRKLLFGILAILTLSIIATTLFIFLALKNGLQQSSTSRTHELGSSIKAGLRGLMLTREPDRIQATLEGLAEARSSILKAFILDKNGRIVYSSERQEIGLVLDRFTERSCRACHQAGGQTDPARDTVIIDGNGSEIARNVMVIYNERICHGCHAPSDRVNGKLIIDRSLRDAYALITLVELILFGSAVACLAVLVPFLSRVLSKGLDTYIKEIISRHTELRLLYVMIERLSKTIDREELKFIIIEILKDTLDADEIDIVLPKDRTDFRAVTWTKKSGSLSRFRVDPGHAIAAPVAAWLAGNMGEAARPDRPDRIFMPIAKGGVPLAFLAARKTDGPFQRERAALTGVMADHIAVALENARLYHLAITDELTRLFTQRHFRFCVEKSLDDHEKYGEKFSLMMLDLDDFKKINDTFGHVVGDAVLREVSQVIQSSIRDIDLAFRYGGEEFAVILPGTGAKGCAHVAERIRRTVQETVFEQARHDIRMTISIGCAVCPDTAQTVRDLILAADKRLYTAKRSGKNRVVSSDA